MTQRELARALDIHSKYVSMIETGVKPLSRKLKIKLEQLQLNDTNAETTSMSPLADSEPSMGCSQCAAKDKEIEWLKTQMEELIQKIPDA